MSHLTDFTAWIANRKITCYLAKLKQSAKRYAKIWRYARLIEMAEAFRQQIKAGSIPLCEPALSQWRSSDQQPMVQRSVFEPSWLFDTFATRWIEKKTFWRETSCECSVNAQELIEGSGNATWDPFKENGFHGTQLKIQIASLTTSRNMISPAAIDHQSQSRIPSLWTTMAAN